MRTAEAATTATTTQQAKREAKREAERETARTQHLPVSASPPFYAPTVNEQPTITADILLFLEEAPQGPEPQLRATAWWQSKKALSRLGRIPGRELLRQ